MTTVMSPHQLASEKRFVLHNVSWEKYERLLKEYESQSAPRLTYDHGDLEVMRPSIPHETASCILSLLVNFICEQFEIDVLEVGSTTEKRADLLQGVEPDGSFYIQNAALMRGVRDLNLKIHPPPDLVIEVDISNPSIPKIPIYANLGVPEIWHFRTDRLLFLTLIKGQYVIVPESSVLPGINSEDVMRYVTSSDSMKRPEWLRAVREWLKSVRNT